MAFVLGMNAKAYHNTGSYGTPTWDEMPNVRDVEINGEAAEADLTTRGGGGWRQRAATIRDGQVEFSSIWDTADTDLMAVKDAWKAGTLIDMAFMDGDIATSGSQGMRAEMAVTQFTRSEGLEDALTVNVSVAPGYSDNAPTWYEVP